MSAVGGVPALRFPEFSGEWEQHNLKDVTAKIQDGTHFSPELSDGGPYKYITSKNIRQGFLDLANVDYISEAAHREIYRRCDVRFGDVLLTKDGASTGACCLNTLDEEFSLLSSVAFVRAKSGVALGGFIFFTLSSSIGQRQIFESIAGQAITRITLEKLRSYKFRFPSLPEQQKIADFLGAVDARVELLRRRRDALRAYKKGMMQRLFTQELRFTKADGSPFPDWQEKRLGEVATFITKGTTPTSVGFEFCSVGVNFVKAESIDDRFSVIKIKTSKISRECHEQLLRSQLREGDILFSIAGTLGRTAIVSKDILPANINQALSIIRFDKLDSVVFINQFLNSEKLKKRIGELLSVGAQPNLSLEQVSNFIVPVPHPEEQQKIADILTALDAKIDAVTAQMDAMGRFKKGLRQQMFV